MNPTIKLYDTKPYDTAFEARVISCESIPETDTWDLILDQTLFFPEEGGQTPDRGTIAQVTVLDVQIESDIIHHVVDKPLIAGDTVVGHIDWAHRYDNMQNHTGEHIFSGLVHSRKGYDNVGFHLSEHTCTMDYNGPLTAEEVRTFEEEAKQVIVSNRPVICEYPSPEKLAVMDYRSKKELTGPVRIVTIPDCDVCACCAPHVTHTGEVGSLKVLHIQNYKGGTRLTIACGMRALHEYQVRQDSVEAISSLLSAPQEEIASAVASKLEEINTLKMALNEARAKLLDIEVASLPADAANVCLFEEGIDNIRLRNAVNAMTAAHTGYCGIFNGNDTDGYSYIIGIQNGDARELNTLLREKYGARGGGKPAMVQGSVKATAEELRTLF